MDHGRNDAPRPRLRVELACQRLGTEPVIARCSALLGGGEETDEFIALLGGPPALRLIGEGFPDHQAYWLRVWAARGLLWAGPCDPAVLRAALADESWRVREMVCKVIARHAVGELLDDVARLRSDDTQRVRQAADRAVHRIVSEEA